VDVVFLDANVLFSAAYMAESRLREFWALPDVELVTSEYAWEEAHRNLPRLEQQKRLMALAPGVRMVQEQGTWALPADVILPEKDRPILCAAILSGATHLITGDAMHFGVWYGQRIGGVLVLKPAAYLQSRQPAERPAESESAGQPA
jgi:predicted nucleic acid-binding protein